MMRIFQVVDPDDDAAYIDAWEDDSDGAAFTLTVFGESAHAQVSLSKDDARRLCDALTCALAGQPIEVTP